MYSDENKSSAIAAILNRFDYVLIDTCSLMDPACPVWMDALHNAKDYRKKREPIIVPRRCYDELKKHSRDKSVDSKRIAAKRGLKILRKAKWDRLLTVAKKDKNENFADNAIYVQVCADRLFSKILIITQDKSLASDLLALNRLRSQQGRPVEVYKLISDGKMVPNLGETNDDHRREPRVGGNPKQTPPVKQKPAQPAKGGTSPAEIQAADARLCAVLSNPNYPDEKKRLDAEAQLEALKSLSPSVKSKLKLKMDVERIQEFLDTGTIGAQKPQPKPEPVQKPAPDKKETPKKPEPAKKSEPMKEEKPAGERLYYGAGKTMQLAVADCAAHYGILFREPTVRYFPQAHGPFDLTSKDRDAIIDLALSVLKGDTKVAFAYKDIPMWAQKASEERYKYWIDVNVAKKAEPKKEEPKPAKAKKTAPVNEKSATEKPEPKAKEEKKPAKAKAVKEPTKKESKPSSKPEQPAKSESKQPAKPAQKEPAKAKPAPTKKEPAKAKPTKKESKSIEEKPAAKETVKSEAKKAAKPAAKKATKKGEPAVSDTLKKAQAADKRLCAVLPNPNYAMKDKIADLKAQRQLLMSLSEAEFKTLKYGPKEIDEWLKANQGFESGIQGE